MSVTRITEFQAGGDQVEGLRDFLASITPGIESSDGCLSCRLLRDRDDGTRFVVIELWESVEAHEASVEGIEPGQLEEVMRLLAAPPKGRYLIDPYE